MAANPKDRFDSDNDRRGSYQNDPRYREYYERLRRENERRKGEVNRQYDEQVVPLTLDELTSQGWDETFHRVHHPTGSETPTPKNDTPNSHSQQSEPQSGKTNRSPTETIHQSSVSAPSISELKPGSILCFDDGSLAIFKDAVSGKDYALFYFLEPNRSLSPRGIFLEQYDYQCIGLLPIYLFEAMKGANRWNRDCIIFHLYEWDFVQLIPSDGAIVSSQVGRPATESNIHRPSSGPVRLPDSEPHPILPGRGQVLRINVAGRVWEAVYWAKDEMGHVIAHCTNKKWALMHLDLNRFSDRMELGETLSPNEVDDIQRQLVTASGG